MNLTGQTQPGLSRPFRTGLILLLSAAILLMGWAILGWPARSLAAASQSPSAWTGSSSHFLAQAVLTDTATATSTLTETPTSTATSTATNTSTATSTETATPSPTSTPTPTGTIFTNTPTATSTATATATITGTPPTPTATGTITPSMGYLLSVSPSEARVGSTFTFRITVSNSGKAPAYDVFITDTFTTYLNLTSATSSKGDTSISTSARTVNVDVGTIAPGETVTIVIKTLVNNTATVTTSLTHNSVMIYTYSGITVSKSSNVVSYKIVVGSTLPSTGGMAKETPSSGLYLPAILIGVALFFLGILGLAAGGRSRPTNPQWGGWYTRMGLLLVAAGLLFTLGGFLLGSTLSQPSQAELAGAPQGSSSTTQESHPNYFSDTPEARIIPWPDELEKLPDYPVPSPMAVLTASPDGSLPDTSNVTRLVIPSVGVDHIVKYVPYDGNSWMIAGLREEIAWMGDTSWPGLGSNTGLAGHVTLRDGSNGPFFYLPEIAVGDEVVLYTEKMIYSYQVRELRHVEEYDLSVVQASTSPQLTLVTCVDWDNDLKSYLRRLVVVAELVSEKPINQQANR